jgi:hypothetical protein
MPVVFPVDGSATRRSFPSAGSLGSVPQLHQYSGALRLPDALPALPRLPSAPRYLPMHVFRSRLGPCIGRCGPGVCSPGFAAPACLSTGDVRISQVPRGPLCTRPVLRPRWAGSARPCPFSRADPVLPSATGTALATTIISISRLHHAARAPAVYASWLGYPSPRKTRFQPGALPLAGRTFTRWVPSSSFIRSSVNLLPSSWAFHLLQARQPLGPRGFLAHPPPTVPKRMRLGSCGSTAIVNTELPSRPFILRTQVAPPSRLAKKDHCSLPERATVPM